MIQHNEGRSMERFYQFLIALLLISEYAAIRIFFFDLIRTGTFDICFFDDQYNHKALYFFNVRTPSNSFAHE